MKWWEAVRVAWSAIWSNRLRSFLTTLGVIIGVASVIAVVAIGQGGQAVILGEIEGLGSNQIWVYPMPASSTGVQGVIEYLDPEDIEAISSRIPEVVAVSPQMSTRLEVEQGATNKSYSVSGTSSDFRRLQDLPVARGRFFTEGDVAATARVAVIGQTVAEELFGGRDPVGDFIHIGGWRFSVIGVMGEIPSGLLVYRDVNDQSVVVPHTTFQRLTGVEDVTLLYARVDAADNVPRAVEATQRLLDQRHGEDTFMVFSFDQAVDSIRSVTGVMTAIVAGIAAIALLVGGIGIMNIMLVSVTERTREIGLRRALGATRTDLLYQFLMEALALSVAGGILGILLGVGLVALVGAIAGLPWLISGLAVVLAVTFSVLVGVVFGVYPATRAAALDPIQALHRE